MKKVILIKNGSDIEKTNMSDELKGNMMNLLNRFSQFAFIEETGDVIGAIDFDGNLDMFILEVSVVKLTENNKLV